MKKLPAFTITELLVVSLLSVLTVALAITAWQLMEKQYSEYEEDSRSAVGLSQLQELLERDFWLCDLVIKNSNSLRCLYPLHTVVYIMTDETIIRNLEGNDKLKEEFPYPTISWIGYFRNIAVEVGPVDFVQINSHLFDRPISLAFAKNYSAEELMRDSVFIQFGQYSFDDNIENN